MNKEKQHRLTGIVILGLITLVFGVYLKTMYSQYQAKQQQAEEQKQTHIFFAWRDK